MSDSRQGPTTDWLNYVEVMATVQGLELDAARRDEIALQLARIDAMVAPLMAFEMNYRDEVAPTFLP